MSIIEKVIKIIDEEWDTEKKITDRVLYIHLFAFAVNLLAVILVANSMIEFLSSVLWIGTLFWFIYRIMKQSEINGKLKGVIMVYKRVLKEVENERKDRKSS